MHLSSVQGSLVAWAKADVVSKPSSKPKKIRLIIKLSQELQI
jgi:hypothetical protein